MSLVIYGDTGCEKVLNINTLLIDDQRRHQCEKRSSMARPRPLDIAPPRWHQRPAMGIKTFFLRTFTWWNGQTFGTQLWTALYGEFVGEDERGNRYYRSKGGKIDPALGFDRRWVIYNGYTEATTIGQGWHGWMHHTVDTPPTQEKFVPRPWEKPHLPNLTGTPFAYRPPGSTLAQARRPEATGDYKAWRPDGDSR